MYSSSMPEHSARHTATRNSGLEAVGAIPWGTHFCQFYANKDDLLETLVPYMKAGLESNEFCLWLTSEALNSQEAESALRGAVPDLDRYIAEQRIEFSDCSQWYREGGRFDIKRSLEGILDKTDKAIDRGLDGLRAAGSGALAWLEQEGWKDFFVYENDIDAVAGTKRILILCPYPLDKCGPREIIDAAANHEFALIRDGLGWQAVENTARCKSNASLRSSYRWPATAPNSSAFAIWTSYRPTSTRRGSG